jgi:hypothetical protein
MSNKDIKFPVHPVLINERKPGLTIGGASLTGVRNSFYSKIVMKKTAFCFICLLNACMLLFQPAIAQPAKSETTFTVENYYKTKWGFADEFINLWKANHYPLLKKAIEKGDIISVTPEKPRLHSGEDTRWDFKVTIVFKNSEKAFDDNLTEPYKKMIYPDLDKLKKDEQHRFELLLAHWDVMVEKVAVE